MQPFNRVALRIALAMAVILVLAIVLIQF